MSMQSLEREILAEAKEVTGNKKLKLKDTMEWSPNRQKRRPKMFWRIVRPLVALIGACLFPIAILAVPISILVGEIKEINAWIDKQMKKDLED